MNRSQDVVHRAVGKAGIVLVAEGNPNRVKGLLAAEKKKMARIVVGRAGARHHRGQRRGPGAAEEGAHHAAEAAARADRPAGHGGQRPAACAWAT